MRSIRVTYHKEKDVIDIPNEGKEENWTDVCEKFNDDVHRVRNVEDREIFNALYECIDEENKSVHYLVEEDDTLHKMKRKNFLRKLGKNSTEAGV